MKIRPIIEDVDDFAEAIYYAEESLAEIEAEYRSEVAAYGDAWPGAVCDIRRIRRRVRRMRAAYERLVAVDVPSSHPARRRPVVADEFAGIF